MKPFDFKQSDLVKVGCLHAGRTLLYLLEFVVKIFPLDYLFHSSSLHKYLT